MTVISNDGAQVMVVQGNQGAINLFFLLIFAVLALLLILHTHDEDKK